MRGQPRLGTLSGRWPFDIPTTSKLAWLMVAGMGEWVVLPALPVSPTHAHLACPGEHHSNR
eukprot:11166126-Lingulodinium_polyedra.AAC.1